MVLGNLTVPNGVTQIKGLKLWAEVPTRLKLTITDPDTGVVREEIFDVGPGFARKVDTDTRRPSSYEDIATYRIGSRRIYR
ncbi:MAG: hypothetical protein V3V98_06850 [Thermoplasmata archaeon]